MDKEGKIVITRRNQDVFYGYFQDGEPVELYVCPENVRSNMGNIYLGRIEHIAEGLGAAFVRIGNEETVYLPLSERGIELPVKTGDPILVQIKREGTESKQPKASRNISITGITLALASGKGGVYISKKIKDPSVREELLSKVKKMDTDGFDVIIRTNAASAAEEDLLEELELLKNRFSDIIKRAKTAQFGTVLYREAPHYILLGKELPAKELSEIKTDQPDIFEELTAWYGGSRKITLYEDSYSLWNLYRFEHHFDKALSKRVWLDSGAFLIIEETEAMTVIDVNSGSVTGASSKMGNVGYQVNLEAAKEIARQIRIRNLSGIIVTDFINLNDKKKRTALLDALREACAKDRIRAVVFDYTSLGLVEMTRKKVLQPLSAQIRQCYDYHEKND